MSEPIRWCSRGDTIASGTLRVRIPAGEEGAMACAQANEFIAAGRWRVSHCGWCDRDIEDCECKRIGSS